jgi:hypothetical protein
MATSGDALLAAGWRWDPIRNGYVRPDTTWNAATQSWSTQNNVGGTIFIPRTTAASSGVSGVAQTANSPALPAVQQPSAIVAPQVGVSGTVQAQPVTAALADWQAPDPAAVQDVRADSVDPFLVEDPELLRQLDQQAQADLALGGSLSAQEERDAQQSARAAFAARGMAMGNPAVAAEILNRDQYSRQRLGERRQFAQGITGLLSQLDLANQGARNQFTLANLDARLRALLANQGTRLSQWQTGAQGTLQQSLANAAARNQVALANEGNRLSAGQFNIDAALRAAIANQGATLSAGQSNAGSALDYARLGVEGSLGQFNAATNRMNANVAASNSAQAFLQNYLSNLNDRQYLAGVSAAGQPTGTAYRPLGTWGTTTSNYRAL